MSKGGMENATVTRWLEKYGRGYGFAALDNGDVLYFKAPQLPPDYTPIKGDVIRVKVGIGREGNYFALAVQPPRNY